MVNDADRIRNETVDLCLVNAKRFAAASKLVLNEAPNVAYVMATTAIEEVGKAVLVGLHLLDEIRDTRTPWLEKHAEDHEKKLFWALWSPMMGDEIITPVKFQEYKNMSLRIHQRRLSAQYTSTEASLRANPISTKEAGELIGIAEARIAVEEVNKRGTPDESRKELMKWFLANSGDSSKTGLIFGSSSMKKLAELKEVYPWILWLKEQFDFVDDEAKKAVEAELAKPIGGVGEEGDQTPKWKISLKLQSGSHSMRDNVLQKWSKDITWIKMRSGDKKKNELLVDVLLPTRFHAKTLYWRAWGVCNHILIALNIGTFGYFWWYLPEKIEKYYDKIFDLEKNMELHISPSPKLALDWGKCAISEQDMQNVALCVRFVVECNAPEIFNHYITALGFLGKNDILMRFEANAFEHFTEALEQALLLFDNVPQDKFRADPIPCLGEIADRWQQDLREKIRTRIAWVYSDKVADPKIALDDVGAIKILLDAVIIRAARKKFGQLNESGELDS